LAVPLGVIRRERLQLFLLPRLVHVLEVVLGPVALLLLGEGDPEVIFHLRARRREPDGHLFGLEAVLLLDPNPGKLPSRGRPTGIALAALSLALAQPTAPDLWFSPGPQASGKERVL
jgi:hypothetical protein